MSQIQYLDKYDKEFVNLMLEINNRSKDFSKLDKLKINSWIKSLCLPTNNILWKKNRNLYALKLLDNILNLRLENPFTKFADLGENLPMLDPILVKSQLSNKVRNIINNIHPDSQIQNFIDANMDNNGINTSEIKSDINLDILNKNRPIYRPKTPTTKEINNRSNKFNNNRKNIRSQYNHINGNNNNNYYSEKGEDINIDNSNVFHKGDQLLNKNYFDFDKKLSNEPGYYKKTKPNIDSQRKKLQSTIAELENEFNQKNQIINQQELDIQQLKNKITQLEKRIKIIFKMDK